MAAGNLSLSEPLEMLIVKLLDYAYQTHFCPS